MDFITLRNEKLGKKVCEALNKRFFEAYFVPTKEEILPKVLELIPPEMVVQRITGDGPIDLMVGPMWSVNKWEVLNGIDAELKRRDSWQGKFYKKEDVTTK